MRNIYHFQFNTNRSERNEEKIAPAFIEFISEYIWIAPAGILFNIFFYLLYVCGKANEKRNKAMKIWTK